MISLRDIMRSQVPQMPLTQEPNGLDSFIPLETNSDVDHAGLLELLEHSLTDTQSSPQDHFCHSHHRIWYPVILLISLAMVEISVQPGTTSRPLVLLLRDACLTHLEMDPLKSAPTKCARILKLGLNTNVLIRLFKCGVSPNKLNTKCQQTDPLELVSMFIKIS